MSDTNLVHTFLCNLVSSAFSRRKGKSPGSDSLFQAIRLCGRRREDVSRKKTASLPPFPCRSLTSRCTPLSKRWSFQQATPTQTYLGVVTRWGGLRDEPKELLRGRLTLGTKLWFEDSYSWCNLKISDNASEGSCISCSLLA